MFIPSEEVQEQMLAQSIKNKMQNTDWKFEAFKDRVLFFFNEPSFQSTLKSLFSYIENAQNEKDLSTAVGGLLLNLYSTEVQLKEIFRSRNVKLPEIINIMKQFGGGEL